MWPVEHSHLSARSQERDTILFCPLIKCILQERKKKQRRKTCQISPYNLKKKKTINLLSHLISFSSQFYLFFFYIYTTPCFLSSNCHLLSEANPTLLTLYLLYFPLSLSFILSNLLLSLSRDQSSFHMKRKAEKKEEREKNRNGHTHTHMHTYL